MKKTLHCGYVNEQFVEVNFSVLYKLKVDGKVISYSNSIDNIHGDLFECLMSYFKESELTVEKVNQLFYQVQLFIDCVKQEKSKED